MFLDLSGKGYSLCLCICAFLASNYCIPIVVIMYNLFLLAVLLCQKEIITCSMTTPTCLRLRRYCCNHHSSMYSLVLTLLPHKYCISSKKNLGCNDQSQFLLEFILIHILWYNDELKWQRWEFEKPVPYLRLSRSYCCCHVLEKKPKSYYIFTRYIYRWNMYVSAYWKGY